MGTQKDDEEEDDEDGGVLQLRRQHRRGELLQPQYTTGADTIFQGIHRLHPGETIRVKAGRVVERRQIAALPSGPPQPIDAETALRRLDADAVGFLLRTTSLSSDIEVRFDERVPVDYSLFGIRYLILPPDRQPLVPADKMDEQGQFVLWQIRSAGYIQVVDTAGVITTDRSNIGTAMDPFIGSNELLRGVFPTVAFAGAPAAHHR